MLDFFGGFLLIASVVFCAFLMGIAVRVVSGAIDDGVFGPPRGLMEDDEKDGESDSPS